MAKLILSLDGSIIREIPLDKDRVTIGRKPHNDIQIENLAVSGDHARVVTILNDSFLEDLGSTNGTLVNGNPIKKHILQNNDVIEIGKYTLKYVADAQAARPAAPAGAEEMEKTMIVRPQAGGVGPAAKSAIETPRTATDAGAPTAPSTAAPAATPDAPRAPQPAVAPAPGVIQILNGPGAGRQLELTKTVTTLGKPGVQVAAITRRPHGYFIAHVEGKSFPAVNGTTLSGEARALNDHDVIELAGVKMEFFLKN